MIHQFQCNININTWQGRLQPWSKIWVSANDLLYRYYQYRPYRHGRYWPIYRVNIILGTSNSNTVLLIMIYIEIGRYLKPWLQQPWLPKYCLLLTTVLWLLNCYTNNGCYSNLLEIIFRLWILPSPPICYFSSSSLSPVESWYTHSILKALQMRLTRDSINSKMVSIVWMMKLKKIFQEFSTSCSLTRRAIAIESWDFWEFK